MYHSCPRGQRIYGFDSFLALKALPNGTPPQASRGGGHIADNTLRDDSMLSGPFDEDIVLLALRTLGTYASQVVAPVNLGARLM